MQIKDLQKAKVLSWSHKSSDEFAFADLLYFNKTIKSVENFEVEGVEVKENNPEMYAAIFANFIYFIFVQLHCV